MKSISYILLINTLPPDLKQAIKTYSEQQGIRYKTILLKRKKNTKTPDTKKAADITLYCDFSEPYRIAKVLAPYKKDIKAITCFGEKNIKLYRKVIPHFPHLTNPTPTSLSWATNKIAMRKLLATYDKNISPRFTVIHDASEKTIKKIKKNVDFPLVLKPAGLASSLLVTMCYHEEDVAHALKKMFNRINILYKRSNVELQPTVLVEEFMEGEMYSVDAYVNKKGIPTFCPFVHVKTGRAIGFDDFFGYTRLTPTTLSKEAVQAGRAIAKKAIQALNLINTSAHVELMKTDNGWKIIELGPRVGGYRNTMYKLSFGLEHYLNDVLVKMGKKPKLPKKKKQYTVQIKFYAKQEGKLQKIDGLKKAKKLPSLYQISVKKGLGSNCRYSKNGGGAVIDATLCNKNKSDLLADVRRLETWIKIVTK